MMMAALLRTPYSFEIMVIHALISLMPRILELLEPGPLIGLRPIPVEFPVIVGLSVTPVMPVELLTK